MSKEPIQEPDNTFSWLGTSLSDQETADAAVPELLKCRALAPVLFLSVAPLLGPVDLSYWLGRVDYDPNDIDCGPPDMYERGIDWVIVGGESGPGARPCNLEWIRDIVRQCKDAEVPCFVKQLGSKHVAYDPEKDDVCQVPLEDRKGGDPSEWPEDIRVQEFPAVEVK